MSKYKAAVFTEPKRVEIVEKEIPQLSSGETLIKIKTCCICTLEKWLYTGVIDVPYPVIGGHEISGIVEETTSYDLKKGDKVVLDLLNRCGECEFCRTGYSNHCINKFKRKGGMLGGFAEYIVVNSREVFKIDESVPFDVAALTEPIADCLHSYKQAKLSPTHSLMIVGAGTMGLLHLMIAKNWGIKTIVTEMDESKMAVAKNVGAVAVINIKKENVGERIKEITNNRGVDVAIVTVPSESPIRQAIEVVGVRGTVVLYTASYPSVNFTVDSNSIHYKELKIIGSISRTEKDFFNAVDLQNSKRLNLAQLITKKYRLDDIKEALEESLDPATYRIAIIMD